MPLYEYVCEDCELVFDKLRPIKDSDKPIACESCKSDHTKRKVSGFFSHSSSGQSNSSSSGCSSCSSRSCSTCRG